MSKIGRFLKANEKKFDGHTNQLKKILAKVAKGFKQKINSNKKGIDAPQSVKLALHTDAK